MKKIMALLCFVFAFVPAQKLFAQQFSLGAGWAYHFYVSHSGSDAKTSVAPGLSLDFEASIPMSDAIAIATGASFTGVAGYHFGGNSSVNLGEIFFDVPVRAKFNIPLPGRVKMGVFAGPVLSVNLVSIDAHASNTINNYEAYPNLRRFDILLGAGVSVDIIDHIRAIAGFDYGLLDRNAKAGEWLHRGQLKVGVQYIF
jgi:hypothetical protein